MTDSQKILEAPQPNGFHRSGAYQWDCWEIIEWRWEVRDGQSLWEFGHESCCWKGQVV